MCTNLYTWSCGHMIDTMYEINFVHQGLQKIAYEDLSTHVNDACSIDSVIYIQVTQL